MKDIRMSHAFNFEKLSCDVPLCY